MQSTTYYGYNLVEGTDLVNPLTQFNPNFTGIDADLKGVDDKTIDSASCVKSGSVHAVTRTNTSADVFKFTATGDWNEGDTMTVDGSPVTVFAPDGTAPSNKCFVINSEVFALINGSRVTLYAFKTLNTASFASAGSIAPVEISPASIAHTVGSYIMFNGVRYKVVVPISAGDPITVGTNVVAENLATTMRGEYYTGAAFASNVSAGAELKVYKVGGLCIVTFFGVQFTTAPGSTDAIINGLPAPANTVHAAFNSYNANGGGVFRTRIYANANQLTNLYSNFNTSDTYYGTIAYVMA